MLHLTADGLPLGDVHNLMEFDVNDIEISPDGQFALVACTGGVFVVTLSAMETLELPGGGVPTAFQRDQAWKLTWTQYVKPTPDVPSPFPQFAGFNEVVGVGWLGTSGVVLSLSGPGNTGALALYSFGHHSKSINALQHILTDQPAGFGGGGGGYDEIVGTDYYVGGAVEAMHLGDGLYRVYATSNSSGAVVEFKVEPVANPTLIQLALHASTTHFTETPDCRPYLWPGFGSTPVIVVPRYQQTLLLLKGSPLAGGN